MVQKTESRAFGPAAGRSRKQRMDGAIAAALQGDWKTAAEENKSLLDDDPRDVEAANRLGKALTELGRSKQAIEAYRHALGVEPGNTIARKNLARLETVKAPKPKRSSTSNGHAAPKRAVALIESSDRAAEFLLQRPDTAALQDLEAGEHVDLQPDPRGVVVTSADGRLLGSIEPRAGLRLKRMIEAGNRYEVFVRTLTDEGSGVVHIRETYKDPSMVGQASFLPSPTQKRRVVRAYTKTSVVRRGDDSFEVEDDIDEGPSADSWRPRARSNDADEDVLNESGFSSDDVEIDDDEDFGGDDDEPETEEVEE